jgi:plastocyanin
MPRLVSRNTWGCGVLLTLVLAAGLIGPAAAVDASAAEDEGASGPITSSPVEPEGSAGGAAVMPQPAEAAPTPPDASVQVTAAPVSRAKSSSTKSVSMIDFAFDPGAITVRAGDTVQWTNLGTAKEGHSASSPEFDSGILQTGGTYSFTFRQPGTFSYVCSTHPDMKGSVRVLAASTGSNNSQPSGKKKSGGSGSSAGSPGSSSQSSASSPVATGSGSESAAVSSPGAAGSNSSLPSTGSDSLLLASIGLLLLDLGLALRLAPIRPRR